MRHYKKNIKVMRVKKHTNKKNVKYTKEEKYFPNLTDKKMLKKMELYESLCDRHLKLQNVVDGVLNTNIHPVSKDKMKDLIVNIDGVSNLIKQELNNLMVVYNESVYRDFINQTNSFTKLLCIYKNFIQNAESFLAEIKKTPTITPPQNEK